MSVDPRFPAPGEAPYMSVLKGDTFFARTFPNYKKMFFDKGSFRPVVHAMLVVGFIGYTLDYFQHLRCACCPPRLSPARPPPDPPPELLTRLLRFRRQSSGTATRRSIWAATEAARIPLALLEACGPPRALATR